jgi:hypothetical protein
MYHSKLQRVVMALTLAGLAAGLTSLLAAGPPLSATFKVADVQVSGDSVHLTFSFSLHTAQPSDLTVEAIKLGNPSAADRPYATFSGGTIPAGGELTESKSVTIPNKAFKKWQAGEPATLFVRTPSENGSVWTRVDATAASPVK